MLYRTKYNKEVSHKSDTKDTYNKTQTFPETRTQKNTSTKSAIFLTLSLNIPTNYVHTARQNNFMETEAVRKGCAFS